MMLARCLPRFRHAYRALDELASRERWTREQIDAWQIDRLNALWTTASRHAPYYVALKQTHRLPDRFSTLDEFSATMPILRKALVRQHREWFLTRPPSRGGWHSTSGSTGVPTSVFWPRGAHREALQARYRLLAEWDLDFFDRSVMIWGDPLAGGAGMAPRIARSRRALEDRLRNRRRLQADDIGRDTIRRHLDALARYRPAHIYAYSSAGYLLARGAIECRFACDSIRVVVVTADMLLPHMRATILRGFRAPVVVEYGAVDCGFLAGESRDGLLHVREDQVILETASRADGRYDILVTPLVNAAFPLIRYEIDDVTEAPLRRGESGFAVLQGLSGRSNDLLVTRSGSFVHTSAVSHLFAAQPAIVRYRLHQAATGSVRGEVELNDPGAPPDLRPLEHRIQGLLHGYPVSLEAVKKIVDPPSGKHRWIVTEAMP